MNAAKKSWTYWLEERGLETLLDLPGDVANQDWQPDVQDRTAAWELYTELRTRITTQPLHYLAGDEEATLKSIYQLFPDTRSIIRKYPQAVHFATLSVFVLNQVVRPLTAQWHKWQVEGHLDSEDVRHEFRLELKALQIQLRLYMTLLGYLAQGDSFIPGSESGGKDQQNDYDLGASVDIELVSSAGTKPDVAITMDRMIEVEKKDIEARRCAVDLPTDTTDGIGLALSGGGIRAATVALGVLQSLGDRGLLRCVDYLSTVSGGGYTGAFLSTYLDNDSNAIGLQRGQQPFAGRDQPETDAIQHLRNNSRYLLAGGLLGRLSFIAQLFYGIAVQLLIVLVLLGVAAWITSHWSVSATAAETSLPRALQYSAYLLIAIVAVLPLLHRLSYDVEESSRLARLPGWLERTAVFMLLIVAVLGFWEGMVYIDEKDYFLWLADWVSPLLLIAVVAVAPLLIAGLAFAVGIVTPLGKTLLLLTSVTMGVLILVTFYVILQSIPLSEHGNPELWPWLTTVGGGLLVLAIVLILVFVNINFISLHRYYRNRLGEAYLIYHDTVDNYIVAQPLKHLSALGNRNKSLPYHLINAALNVTRTEDPKLKRRGSDFFLFSKYFCGSEASGYHETQQFENLDNRLDLGTAMAISGAAAAPYMGAVKNRSIRPLLVMLNIRLSYWVPNPARKYRSLLQRFFSAPGVLYILRELTGRLRADSHYLNLSDGGHIENLAIYELLRRQCKFIIAIDAEADPDMIFGSFNRLLRLVKQDFNINIDIDLSRLQPQPNGKTRMHFALGKIHYDADSENVGYLLYIKSSLTGNEPHYILDYQRRNPSFPHQSTADQFFDEDQFEVYRALGYHMGEELFAAELLASATEPDTVRDWFRALAGSLLRD